MTMFLCKRDMPSIRIPVPMDEELVIGRTSSSSTLALFVENPRVSRRQLALRVIDNTTIELQCLGHNSSCTLSRKGECDIIVRKGAPSVRCSVGNEFCLDTKFTTRDVFFVVNEILPRNLAPHVPALAPASTTATFVVSSSPSSSPTTTQTSSMKRSSMPMLNKHSFIAPPPPPPPPPPSIPGNEQQPPVPPPTTRNVEMSLLDLLNSNMLQVGERLEIKYQGISDYAHLLSDGALRGSDGLLFKTPSNWSLHVKRAVNPSLQSDNGWGSVTTSGGVTLANLRKQAQIPMEDGENNTGIPGNGPDGTAMVQPSGTGSTAITTTTTTTTSTDEEHWKRTKHSVTLESLLKSGALVPGARRLVVKYKGATYFGDLLSDGSIRDVDTNTIYTVLSRWTLACKLNQNPGLRSDGGWLSASVHLGDDKFVTLDSLRKAQEAGDEVSFVGAPEIATTSSSVDGDVDQVSNNNNDYVDTTCIVCVSPLTNDIKLRCLICSRFAHGTCVTSPEDVNLLTTFDFSCEPCRIESMSRVKISDFVYVRIEMPLGTPIGWFRCHVRQIDALTNPFTPHGLSMDDVLHERRRQQSTTEDVLYWMSLFSPDVIAVRENEFENSEVFKRQDARWRREFFWNAKKQQ